MTTESFAPVPQQLAIKEGIDVIDLNIERNMLFKRKDGVMVERFVRSVRHTGTGPRLQPKY